jgi:hypothetical protein
MIQDILNRSCYFDDKNKDLIKKEGVVFTNKEICDKIINRLQPKINQKICEPSVGKGIFIFCLLEYFRKNGETPESLALFIENNLWCYDINETFIAEFRTLLDIYFDYYSITINPKNIICGDFLLQNNQYDIIFGNPPYVRIQNLDKDYLNILKLELDSVKLGNVDLYFAFIEKALKSSQQIGFIIPNSFIKSKSGKFLRHILKPRINYLYDFVLKKVWKTISTYTCILTCGNITNNLEYNNIIKDKTYLSDDKWIFDELNIGTNKLYDLINYCSVGIATLKDNLYKIDSYDENFCYKNGFKIEKEICKKLIKATKSKSSDDYSWIIYPYDNSKIINQDKLKLNYPNTYEYFLSIKEELLKRDAGKAIKYEEWYAYGRKQGLLKKVNGKRILLPLTFLKSKGIYFITSINEDTLNLSGILVDVKEDKFDEFIEVIKSKEFINYLELNNKTLTDKKDSNDVFLTLTSKNIKDYLY